MNATATEDACDERRSDDLFLCSKAVTGKLKLWVTSHE